MEIQFNLGTGYLWKLNFIHCIESSIINAGFIVFQLYYYNWKIKNQLYPHPVITGCGYRCMCAGTPADTQHYAPRFVTSKLIMSLTSTWEVRPCVNYQEHLWNRQLWWVLYHQNRILMHNSDDDGDIFEGLDMFITLWTLHKKKSRYYSQLT